MQDDEDALDNTDVAATLDGDEDAFRRIVERHSLAVQKQMRNFSRDPEAAGELAHDVFVEAYMSLRTFRGAAPFRHWLARIATLTGYKFWKQKGREKNRVELNENLDFSAREPSRPETSPGEAASLLFDLLATLSSDDRMVMTLMYLENLSQDEIAARMGWTRVMVAVRLYRAKRKLRELGDREPWKGRLEWMLS